MKQRDDWKVNIILLSTTAAQQGSVSVGSRVRSTKTKQPPSGERDLPFQKTRHATEFLILYVCVRVINSKLITVL